MVAGGVELGLVEACVVLAVVVVLLVGFPGPLPPGTVALAVAVAAELPWATLVGRPETTEGPGIVYASGLV